MSEVFRNWPGHKPVFEWADAHRVETGNGIPDSVIYVVEDHMPDSRPHILVIVDSLEAAKRMCRNVCPDGAWKYDATTECWRNSNLAIYRTRKPLVN